MEKLVYLFWAPREDDPDALRRRLLEGCVPRLLDLEPRGLQINLDDSDSAVPEPAPAPADELPIVAQVCLWLDAHDFRAPYEEIMSEVGVRRAGYLVSESLYTDYGRNAHHPQPRSWPDGERSPGLLTLSVFEMPARFEAGNWRGHWYGHQSPMTQWMQPRMRYVRNTVVHGLTPGAPPYAGIVEEGWPSAEHVTNPRLFYGADSDAAVERHVRIMLDSVKHMFDLGRLRNFTLSEYLLKT